MNKKEKERFIEDSLLVIGVIGVFLIYLGVFNLFKIGIRYIILIWIVFGFILLIWRSWVKRSLK